MTHEHCFCEEQEPTGRLVLPPCVECGMTAMDAIIALRSNISLLEEEINVIKRLCRESRKGCELLKFAYVELQDFSEAAIWRDLEANAKGGT